MWSKRTAFDDPRAWRGAAVFAAAGMAGILVAACVTSITPSPTSVATVGPTAVAPSPTPAPTATPSPAYPRNPAPIIEGARYQPSVDPADFVATVDNPFFPLVPGTKFTYGGDEDNEVTVLTETKQILGVTTTVVHDQVFVDGALEEDTLDYYAQDRDGNVWYFGEKTAELKAGKVTSTAGSWEGGVDGGQPGIIMLSVPQVDDSYRQEFLKGEAEDLAVVTAVTGSIKVPAGSWSGTDVLVTEEWTPLEPDVREQKTYARGVGIVKTRVIKGGHEVITLDKIEHVSTALAVMPAMPGVNPLGPQAVDLRRQAVLLVTRRLS